MKFNWLFEYCYDWEMYNGDFFFSEEFVEKYLKEERTGAYLCLFNKDTEENLRMVGSNGKYIFEGDLKFKNEGYVHFVLAKKNTSTKNIIIDNLPDSGQQMTFPNNEIFNEKEIIRIMKIFYDTMTVDPEIELIKKRYLF